MENGIVKVHIKNFKKIEEIDTDLQGKSIFLIGDNEVGKSSFIQAVFSLLSNAKFPETPIKEGEKAAEVAVDFVVDGKKYVARRRFSAANPKGQFEIETEDGLKTERVGFLDHIIGDISFNPFKFVDMCLTADGRKKQVEFLRKLIPAEINTQISEVDQEYKFTFDTRSQVNARSKALDAEIGAIDVPDPDQYKERISVQDLFNELAKINKHNHDVEDLKQVKQNSINRIKSWETDIKSLEKELATCREQLSRDQERLKETEAKLTLMPIQDSEPIKQKVLTAEEHNKKVDLYQKYERLMGEYHKAEDDADELSRKLKNLADKKVKLMEDAKLPVQGLSFDDTGLYIDGLPLTEGQVSTSKIMDLGVKIAVALKPKLKILNIQRGESLGSKRLNDLVEFSQQHGYQLFIEKVESGVDKLTIQFIEA